jgi:hypothetical protein
MKKLLLLLGLASLPLVSFSQLFNTASILKPGSFSIGLEPVIVQDNLGGFCQLGFGLLRSVDLALKAGIVENTGTPYLGADLEWRLKGARPSISITTGAHRNEFGHFGLDGSFNLSFAVGKKVFPYLGFDSDLNFDNYHSEYYGYYHDNTNLLMWFPIGVEIYFRKSVSFILEAEIPLTDNTYYVMGAGFTFYIR